MQTIDAFDMSMKFSMLMIFDCPSGDSNSYSKFSDEILSSTTDSCIIFFDTEIPSNFMKSALQNLAQNKGSNSNLLSQDKKGNQEPLNIISTYDIAQVWLLIGIFSAQNNKKVQIFTDSPESFKPKLQSITNDSKLKTNVQIYECYVAQSFSVTQALNPWSQFENYEVLSNFEVEQLTIILKKFIKQIVTSKSPNNLEKLLNISQNLVKAHLSSIQKEKHKVTADLSFNFIRSLFLDNVLENSIISSAILSNEIQSLQDFETFTKINYTPKFQQIIDKIQQQIQQKQQKHQQMLSQQMQDLADSNPETKHDGDGEQAIEQEDIVVKQAIQALFDQYLSLFNKAKIFEIKRLNKLVKQIDNYVSGFIMKRNTALKNSKEKAQADILQNNHKVICTNILRVINKFGLIRLLDSSNIEHDNSKVQDLLQSSLLKQLKDQDLNLDKQLAIQLFEQPLMIFQASKEDSKNESPDQHVKKDPVDILIDKLYSQMKSSKQFPNSLRELEKLIKRHVVKKGEQLIDQDQDKTLEAVLKRMNQKGMFTQKTRTGESKEHAKDARLKNIDILELYRREKKEDIPIVFESSNYASTINKY